MAVFTLPSPDERGLLGRFLRARYNYERMLRARGNYAKAALTIGVFVWALAAWPRLIPPQGRAVVLALWMVCFTGLVVTALGCRRWLARSQELFEALGSPSKERR